jgi:hypothetical protein
LCRDHPPHRFVRGIDISGLIEEHAIHLDPFVPVIECLFGIGDRKRGKAPRGVEIAGPDRNRTQIEGYRPADRLSMTDGKTSGKALLSDCLCISIAPVTHRIRERVAKAAVPSSIE